MRIGELISGIDYEIVQGSIETEINHISWDTRRITENSLFICVKNRNVDRHSFALEAVNKGAVALVIENNIDNLPQNITVIKVVDSRKAMAVMASTFYEDVAKKLKLIGVTGTNGKTSITYFISNVLKNFGIKCGVIGTIENTVDGEVLRTEKLNPTTPDAIELQTSLSEIYERGGTHTVMEVTSSALSTDRVYNCDFEIGIFTNLTRDHLEEHGTMENYKQAKMKLFNMCKVGIVNIDDPVSQEIIKASNCKIVTYGIENNADIQGSNIEYKSDGVKFTLKYKDIEKRVKINMQGKFNVYNTLATIAACNELGFNIDEIIDKLIKVKGARGRFEMVPNNKGILTIVDYAHSPDSLENVLKTAREISKGKIILAFGCGGNRDKEKRAIMGGIARKYSDYCVITSDNPRSEEPVAIIEDIAMGLGEDAYRYEKIENRKEAINKALNVAKGGDVVIIAGKGHENYQIFKEKTIHFSDYEVIEEYFINKIDNQVV